ncbi:MAG: sigma-54 dependent transcriptional regulator, partial [Pseudomonadota bacterium]
IRPANMIRKDMPSVLVAHSDPETAATIKKASAGRGVGIFQAPDGAGALEDMSQRPFLALLIEDNLPKINGFELLQHARDRHPDLKVVIISRDRSAQAALQAVRSGAFDYLTVPLERADLAACLDRLINQPGTESKLLSDDPFDGRYENIIGRSQALRDLFRLVDKVARTDSTVMIYGESGTGKELIARAIHRNSQRRDNPMIPVNCGAIPEELLESELFGHEKGAFTSAIRTRIGRFELADHGTIFLDEITDMSPKLQVKILRVLQEHEFERIGGTKTIDVNIRVLTATNKSLRQAVEDGRFREDLFYRLNVIPITVPPLRERTSDIPLLVEHCLKRFRQTRGGVVVKVDDTAMEKLLSYPWPGNIRELENIIERMVILTEHETLTLDDLPERIVQISGQSTPQHIEITDNGIDFNQVVSDFEDRLLLQALEKADWVKNKAAQLLKLNRTTLVEKLKKKKIRPPASA